MPRITQPSKEQVRAYMGQRGRACRPPPAPDEIRRQLGWRLDERDHSDDDDQPLAVRLYMELPATMGHLAALIVLDWMFIPARTASASATARRMQS